MWVFEAECEFAGVDSNKVRSIARRISRAAREAEALGLCIFGGTGSGSLRAKDQLIVADLDGSFDGGDGAAKTGSDGLFRGETA